VWLVGFCGERWEEREAEEKVGGGGGGGGGGKLIMGFRSFMKESG